MPLSLPQFSALRYGMFVHFGPYSQLGRGEWVMNREQIPPPEYCRLAADFQPRAFSAEQICSLAVAGGMKYLVFTTMHHDGFRMYDSRLSDFNAQKFCQRDFTAEIVAAARRHGLAIGLYHSLNNWYDQPDAVAALENAGQYQTFIDRTFQRLQELLQLYNPIDILWYDGWWPFNRDGWQAERMNAAMRSIQPWLLFNGRNGLPGDFGTPEQHLSAPDPWRPWEACVTLNQHWGFHGGDHNWKSPLEVIRMLLSCGNGNGNLLLNVGPDGSGAIPRASEIIIRQVGHWLNQGGRQAITGNDPLTFGPFLRQDTERGDWDANGVFTASGNTLFFTLLYPCGSTWSISGLEAEVLEINSPSAGRLTFRQDQGRLTVDLPELLQQTLAPVLQITCDRPPAIYRCGGMRVPELKHPRYDPCPPDLQY
ncbi:MAG: alpha-L-fucosidase [Oligosphaeraceae bacterium]|nr:alpha-L-fucosidase [Oligosphaeraceae bacterium]